MSAARSRSRCWRPPIILLVPSLWYENAPLAVIEAAAYGLGVIGQPDRRHSRTGPRRAHRVAVRTRRRRRARRRDARAGRRRDQPARSAGKLLEPGAKSHSRADGRRLCRAVMNGCWPRARKADGAANMARRPDARVVAAGLVRRIAGAGVQASARGFRPTAASSTCATLAPRETVAADDTAALQAAIDAAGSRHRRVLLAHPHRISCQPASIAYRELAAALRGGRFGSGMILVGESTAGTVIRLDRPRGRLRRSAIAARCGDDDGEVARRFADQRRQGLSRTRARATTLTRISLRI